MDRKLLDYLPPVLHEVMEMRAINEANESEIAIAWDALALVLANQFLETANAYGVSIWEKELKILSKDTDSLEFRKARIKAKWNQQLPYTLPWLRRWLDGIYGQENHKESVEDYAIHLQIDHTGISDASRLMAEILKMLKEVQPSNMFLLLEIVLRLPTRKLRVGGAMAAITQMPIPELDDTISFEDTLRIGGRIAAIHTIQIPEKP